MQFNVLQLLRNALPTYSFLETLSCLFCLYIYIHEEGFKTSIHVFSTP